MSAEQDFPEDPTRPTIQQHAARCNPIEIPWKKQSIALGTGLLLSAKDTKVPNLTNAFQTPASKPELVFNKETFANFRRTASSHSTDTSEHMTFALTVSAEIAGGLISGSAQGRYDDQVDTNSDAERYSIHSSYRYGTITFRDPPALSHTAYNAVPSLADQLAHVDNFVKTYGDYYVGALVLGAENSVMVASTTSTNKTTERLSLTVEVQVLCFSDTEQEDKAWDKYQHADNMSMVGFDTLDGSVTATPDGAPLDPTALKELVNKGQSLEKRVSGAFEAVGLVDGESVSAQTCVQLCKSGLVVSIILLPFVLCEDYVKASRRR